MSTREDLLRHLWESIIDPHMGPEAVERTIAGLGRHPEGPFGDVGPALQRLLDAGAAPRDIQIACRFAAYEAVFCTLYAMDDPGVDGGNVFMLHEELLGADPSGQDGRLDG